MAYQVLARKYRPQRFSDVVGQDHVTRTLLNALAQNRIAHGYIFSGHRGIGKTTIARILAMALNCRTEIGSEKRPTPEPCEVCESCTEIRAGNAVDVIEIDAATNRGIDEIRELRDAARYRPSRDKYKIYILDEAHQITDAAFNALLKTLEEPPDHIIFMMATTQPEDIPQTIRSRCQHFSFHAVKLDDIVGQLKLIARAEAIVVDEATLSLLAEAGDGSMRDALSIMDQAIASAPTVDGQPALEIAQVRELMGSVSNVVYEQVLEAVHANSSADVLAIINRLLDAGNGASQLARQFVRYLRNCIVAKVTNLAPDADATGVAADLLQISPEERRRAARSAALFTEEDLSRFLSIMLRTFDDLGYRQEQRFHLELGLLKLVHVQRLLPIEDLLTQLGPAASSPASVIRPSNASSASVERVGPITPSGSPASPPRPASPFEADRSRKTVNASGSSPLPTATEGSLALADLPEVALPRPHLVQPSVGTPVAASVAMHVEPIHTPSLQTEAISALLPNIDLAALQQDFIGLLASAKGHQSASEQLQEASLALNGKTVEVQTTLSATMLPIVFNAEAERILKSALLKVGGSLKLKFVPGSAVSAMPQAGGTVVRKTSVPDTGSAADLAAQHPIVQQAQRLFSAEISKVIDLRDKK